MARVKYYDSTTQTWKYADMALQTGIHVGTTAPTNEAMLWVDTASNQIDSFPLTDVQDSDGNSLIVNQIAVIPAIPAAQVQADWNESDNTKADYIKNKPTIPTAGTITSGSTGYATGGDVYNAIQGGGVPSGTNNGDILVWNGSAWVSKPKWTIYAPFYQRVDYVQSSGLQYIDTKYMAGSNTRIEITCSFPNGGAGNFVCGSQGDTTRSTEIDMGISGEGHWQMRAGTQWGANIGDSIDTNPHTFIIDNKNRHAYLDGDEISLLTFLEATMPAKGLALFTRFVYEAANSRWVGENNAGNRIYSAKIYENDELVRDYVPCYMRTNNSIGLVDIIFGKFYANSGSGSFTKGNDID